MANYWLHNGFLQVEGEKMSKSLGNFVTIRELLSTEIFGGRSWPGGVLRFAMLQTDYKQPLDWTQQRLSEAARELENWAELLGRVYFDLLNSQEISNSETAALVGGGTNPSEGVVDALSDDLNGPRAVAALRAGYSAAARGGDREQVSFLNDCEFLGLFQRHAFSAYSGHFSWVGSGVIPSDDDRMLHQELKTAIANADIDRQTKLANMLGSRGWKVTPQPDGHIGLEFKGSAAQSGGGIAVDIDERITARAAARKAKNFAEADRIRAELDAMGIALKDAKDPATGELVTTWEVKR
jgi:cysteinyl-tRNA synthetase